MAANNTELVSRTGESKRGSTRPFPTSDGSFAAGVLMLMHKTQGMTRSTENNAPLFDGDEGRLVAHPTSVHSSFIGSDSLNLLADVRL